MPNDTIRRFAITGTDLGIMWDNGDPIRQVLMAFGDTYGYCSVRGPAMAVQHAVPQPRRRSIQNDQCAEWRGLQ